jgi:hypothetical protein
VTVPSVPVARELTPGPAMTPPAGFTVVDEALVDGLPHRVPLGGDLVAVLAVPTGLALAWRDGDPAEPVSGSGDQLAPVDAAGDGPTGAVGRPPVRLFVLQGDRVRGSLPRVAGARLRVGDDGLPPGVQLEVVALAWELRAGTLRGPGDVGARLRLAWRRVDAAPDAFSPPPVHPRVRARQAQLPAGGST